MKHKKNSHITINSESPLSFESGNNDCGFTLIELALVITVMAIISVIYLKAGNAVATQDNYQATLLTMRHIENAIDDFVIREKRLPCPDTDSDGEENIDTSNMQCPSTSGTIPWFDIGISEDDSEDAWRNDFVYYVDRSLSGADPDDTTNPMPCRDFENDDGCFKNSTGGMDFRPVLYGRGNYINRLNRYGTNVYSAGDATSPTSLIMDTGNSTAAAYAIVSRGANYSLEQPAPSAISEVLHRTLCAAGANCADGTFDDIVIHPSLVHVIKRTGLSPEKAEDS